MKPKLKWVIECPTCHTGSFDISHLTPPAQFKGWRCRHCGQGINGSISATSEVDIELTDVAQPIYSLLKLDPQQHPVYVVVKDFNFSGVDNLQCRYEERSCPTNYLYALEAVIFEKDTDPHGLFRYVGSAPIPVSHLEDSDVFCNLSFEELNALLGNSLTEKETSPPPTINPEA